MCFGGAPSTPPPEPLPPPTKVAEQTDGQKAPRKVRVGKPRSLRTVNKQPVANFNAQGALGQSSRG